MKEEFKMKRTIDEEEMMALMGDGVRSNGFTDTELNAPSIKEEPKKQKRVKKEQVSIKKYNSTDYEKLFFKDVKSTARHGKSVYINPDHHKKLSRIIQVIGSNNTTIYAYLSNLLDHHFKEFEQQITESFNEKNTPLF